MSLVVAIEIQTQQSLTVCPASCQPASQPSKLSGIRLSAQQHHSPSTFPAWTIRRPVAAVPWSPSDTYVQCRHRMYERLVISTKLHEALHSSDEDGDKAGFLRSRRDLGSPVDQSSVQHINSAQGGVVTTTPCGVHVLWSSPHSRYALSLVAMANPPARCMYLTSSAPVYMRAFLDFDFE